MFLFPPWYKSTDKSILEMAFCDQGFHFKPVGDHEYGWEVTHGMPVAALNRGGLMLLVVLAVLDHGIGWEMSGRVWHGVLVAALDRGCGWKVEVGMDAVTITPSLHSFPPLPTSH